MMRNSKGWCGGLALLAATMVSTQPLTFCMIDNLRLRHLGGLHRSVRCHQNQFIWLVNFRNNFCL